MCDVGGGASAGAFRGESPERGANQFCQTFSKSLAPGRVAEGMNENV